MRGQEEESGRLWSQVSAEMGEFELIGEIGRGGSGVIFHARQRALEREVALKILLTDDAARQAGQELRFEREAQALAALSHPGIVQLYDYGRSVSGLHYIVMEYVEGSDLAAVMQERGALGPEQAVEYTLQLCEALEYAHKQGIVHRDIKPANVLISPAGYTKITDFGLVKIRANGETEAPRSTLLAGTPDYLPPEAFSGEPVWDRGADTYALGVMLYQMLTGSLPRGAFRTPTAWVANLHPQLDRAVMRAIAERAQDRFQSAAEMQARLMRCWEEGVMQPIPPPTFKNVPVAAKAPEGVKASVPMQEAVMQSPLSPSKTVKPPPRAARARGFEREWWLVIAVLVLLALAVVWMMRRR